MTGLPANEYASANGERFLEELEALTRIPSVSTDPAHGEDMTRAANWLKERMQKAGLQGVEVIATASAKISCRLVNDQEPSKVAEQIESYLH